MSDGLGTRIAHLRKARGISAGELAVIIGVPHGELLALESASRRRVSPAVVKKLADWFNTATDYLLEGKEPSPGALRNGFFRHYDALEPDVRSALKFAPIQARMELVLEFLEQSYPTIFDRAQVAGRLGYSPDALADVLSGQAQLQSRLLRLLAGLVGLTIDFLVRGDFFGGVVESEESMSPAMLSQYYQVVQEAIAAGISPAALRKAVLILAIRDQEE